MRRLNRFSPRSSRSARTGAGVAPVVAAVGGFAIVLGALFYVSNKAQDQAQTRSDHSPATVKSPAVTPKVVARNISAKPNQPARQQRAAKRPIAARPVADATALREKRLQSQLSAGEFGPALETATTATNPVVRTRLLKQVADAEMRAGEFAAARSAIRRIPDRVQRTRISRERAARQAQLAGGSGADFEQLIELITTQTSGKWVDVDGEGGTITEFETGVRVDPNGLLVRLSREEQTGRLTALGVVARKADLNTDMAQVSGLRLVSLRRLEQEIAARLAAGQPVPKTMKLLAGLTKVEYVFVDPQSRDIILGGPAEGWQYTQSGIPVGTTSGRPTLQLDDFVTVLRTFSPGGAGYFNCLIVPRQENLKRTKAYADASTARGPLASGGVRNFMRQLQRRMGLQDVVINGIAADSRVARVIAEADYRMKLIGIGRLKVTSAIPSYFALLAQTSQKAPPSMNALRWWMTMKYDAVLHSPDRNVFRMTGSSVLCQSENELIQDSGKRVHTGKADPTNLLFARNFTRNYAKLARRDLVFADLQNIFDLSLTAALIRHEGLDGRIGWNLGIFAPRGSYHPAQYEPAKTVMSVSAYRKYKGGEVVVQVAGGVRADLMSVLKNKAIYRQDARVGEVAARAGQLPKNRWWWDAATK